MVPEITPKIFGVRISMTVLPITTVLLKFVNLPNLFLNYRRSVIRWQNLFKIQHLFVVLIGFFEETSATLIHLLQVTDTISLPGSFLRWCGDNQRAVYLMKIIKIINCILSIITPCDGAPAWFSVAFLLLYASDTSVLFYDIIMRCELCKGYKYCAGTKQLIQHYNTEHGAKCKVCKFSIKSAIVSLNEGI